MLRDLRIAVRSLAHRPGFATAVILTLGLGLGANAALFSLLDAVMLRALPYPEAERLVAISETVRRGDSGDTVERRTLSYPDFEAIQSGVSAFDTVAVRSEESFVMTGGERTVRVLGERVSSGYFDVLSVDMALGGGFLDGVEHQAILSHGLWQSSFGGDAEIVGRTLILTGEPHQVVGVTAAGFSGVMEGQDLWTPIEDLSEQRRSRDSRFLESVARLAPGASLDVANQQLQTVFAGLEEEFSENAGYGAVATSLHEEIVGDLKKPAQLLLAAVGLLLLIACANVANLLLAHRMRLRRQAAVRLALGAGAADLMRWSLLEALVLGVMGGALGLLLATWGVDVLVALSPVELPNYASLDISGNVVGFAMLLAVVVASVLGLATAFQIRGETVFGLLRQGAATAEGPGGGARRWLLAAEVGLAFLVAVGAISTAASWRSTMDIDPGFDADAATFRVAIPAVGEAESPGKPDPQRAALRQRVIDVVGSIPGVDTVALASDSPLGGGFSATVVSPQGALPRPGAPYGGGFRTYAHTVSAGYFEALGIAISGGRGFDDARSDSLPIAVVSRQFADRLWPGESNPIGRRFKFGTPLTAADLAEVSADPEDDPWITVAGWISDVRHRNLIPNPERIAEDPDLYLPLAQWPRRNLTGLVKMKQGDVAAILPEVGRRLETVHTDLAVFGLRTLAEDLERHTARSRFGTVLMGLFALLSLGLAGLGVYSTTTYRVSEQTREIGIRMALGADRRRVVRRVVVEGMITTSLGLAAGCAVVLASARFLALGDLLHQVDPGDPRIIAVALAVLTIVTLAACAIPARRASRIDPLVALREE